MINITVTRPLRQRLVPTARRVSNALTVSKPSTVTRPWTTSAASVTPIPISTALISVVTLGVSPNETRSEDHDPPLIVDLRLQANAASSHRASRVHIQSTEQAAGQS